ncbi:neuroguidin isoform X2 [Onychostruthus taczanowskii]|uniref:neuroguidin isoform X2 n=1 Tax=Onychostruthus taczanowskii TaxID=356909 RepID=UPI001B80B7F3|nr:neuroguidin isoform X2 [Onychostruthus taczanowskii]
MAASEAVALLEALRAQAAEVAAHGREMLRKVRGGQLETKEQGVSLLQVRSQALLSYLQDLALLVCSKTRGGSLKNSGGALERLLETRVVLEKLRPLEQRLKYHLEKLLRAAASGGRGAEDPLSFRPAPSNMAAQEEDEGEEGQGGGAKAPGLGGGRRYVPPRLVPVACGESGNPAFLICIPFTSHLNPIFFILTPFPSFKSRCNLICMPFASHLHAISFILASFPSF